MRPELMYIILSYGRPKVLSMCINSLLNNTNIKPNEIWILDDGSDERLQQGLVNFSKTYSRPDCSINLSLNGNNTGIGWQFEQAYNLIKWKNPKIVGLIESDYIWRREFMEDIQAVFEASPYTIAIPGVSHPDMIDRSKTHGSFCDLMVDQFGEDVESRPDLYEPFYLETRVGKIKVQGVSNSCGCMFLHWERLQQFLFAELGAEKQYWKAMDRAFHKNGTGDRRYASDAHLSGTITYLWEEWAKKYNIDITKNFAWLDICDYSIGQHLCALGINGNLPGIKEGQTFVGSPTWVEDYNNFDRKKLEFINSKE